MRTLAASLLLLVAGCASSGSTVVVLVSSSGSVAATQLTVTATLAGITRSFDVPLAQPGFPPSHSFAIAVAPELMGTMTVHIDALGPAGLALASGDGSAPVAPGQVSQIEIHLDSQVPDGGSDGPPDLGTDAFGSDGPPDLANTCSTNADCPTQVCKSNNMCAALGDVAYVDNRDMMLPGCILADPQHNGSKAHPACDLPTALALGTSYVHVAPSAIPYAPLADDTNAWSGKTIVGPGRSAPLLATLSANAGPDALEISTGSLIIEGMDFRGQIECNNIATIQLYDVSIHDSIVDGISVGACTLVYQGGTITNAAASGVRTNTSSAMVSLVDVTIQSSATAATEPTSGLSPAAVYLDGNGAITVDRCFIGPANGVGLYLGTGTYSVTNTFIVENVGFFAVIAAGGTGVFQFNTVVNNRRGVNCMSPVVIEASIFSGNTYMGIGEFNSMNSCALINGTTTSTDLTQPIFVNPAGHDYRLDPINQLNTTCCIDKVHSAVDGGASMLSGHDYYLRTRPLGLGWDVGAHEAQ
jgi:hypothetical protein